MRAGFVRSSRFASRAACLIVLGLVAPLLPSSLPAGELPAISWRTRFEQARAEARSRNRPLWVQFTGSWCGFCRKMEHETLAQPEVASQARDHFVPVMVHAEDREDLVAHYGVSGLPATVVLKPTGEVIARHEGYAETAEFLAFLHSSRPAPRERSDLALAGYCPVSLVQGKGLTPGKLCLAVRHDGREYRFANPKVRDVFLKDPERFLPSHGGQCVVSRVDRDVSAPGNPHCGVYYRGRLYLCRDDDARRRFASDPDRYASSDVADDGNCPHCREVAGRKVRGVAEYAVTHADKRYLFPDTIHLEAFRAAPEKYVR